MRDVHSNYDSEQARNYDRDREVEQHWHLENRYVEEFFSGRSPVKLLDVPVGTGRFVQCYRRVGDVIGIDASPEMLDVAINRVRELHLNNVAIQLGDIFSLPFSDGHFDAAVCWRFAHLFPPSQLAAALSELARVTKGTILLQAYVRGPFLSRLSSRLLRLPGRLTARLGVQTGNTPPRWSHIKAYFHSQETLQGIIASAGLKVDDQRSLCAYQGHDVRVFVLKTNP